MNKLENKIALITGGSSGIGLATAKKFISEGARVIITGRNKETLEQAIEKLDRQYVTAIQSDISNIHEQDKVFSIIKAKYGRLDILFANAGIIMLSDIQNSTEKEFDNQFDINVKGTFFTVQRSLPLMPRGGAIILTSSIAHHKGLEGHNIYAATKAALRSFARSWTTDLKERGIRVNCLSPGPVETPIIGKMGVAEGERNSFDMKVSSKIPIGRLGKPEEVAAAALFLASDDSSFISGIDLSVDGGMGQI
ncbi:TPA: SDR family oxidoreductase [Citrobacter koseri]|uniref:glucose 1-dehydrogenase n=1 Tax=Enterobacterales TaxID=91347 RepID=UPI000DFB1335|nr:MULTISPECIES: glucose 1-dehydrogenase [Enterobacterales]MCE5348760.1 SDR family oxidoreductase [Citrobacter koseri]MDM3026942.1 SDR family oxidoreductase [Citrobacter sp. CK194]STT21273.1 3-oxoacyl-ACP reductase [Citrobacter koseri]HCC5977249.1 SDR family oxidoreductase [Citrobacter koseri]HCT5367130.1 SDR family oxidoreductase [Citrobacter koseri]